MPPEIPVFRFLAIGGFVGLAGIFLWSAQPQRFAFGEGHTSRIVQPQADESEQRARFLRASFIRTEADQISAARTASANCKREDLSAAEMEIILQEMIRRGWQPPSRVAALADLHMTSGSALFPLDPDAPMPNRYSTAPGTAEDGPIPPVPSEFQDGQPTTAPSTDTATSLPVPAPAAPTQLSAADLIAAPRPPPN
jgi:hypothetical protein